MIRIELLYGHGEYGGLGLRASSEGDVFVRLSRTVDFVMTM